MKGADRYDRFRTKAGFEKEWDIVKKKEERFFAEQKEKKDSALNRMLEEKVPEKLQATLDAAFSKAFTLVFHRGTAVIERTYRKEAMKEAYEINSYAIGVKRERKDCALSKTRAERGAKNLAVSSVEESAWESWVSVFQTFLSLSQSC